MRPEIDGLIGLVGVLAACGGASLFLVRLTSRRARREQARRQALAEDRDRRARALHDSLLQNTQGVVLTMHAARTRLDAGDVARAKALLDRALADSDEIVIEGRERIQQLDAAAASVETLPEVLELTLQALARGRLEQCRLHVQGDPRALLPSVADELHRFAREAVVDALAHAHARQIEVDLVYGEQELRLGVRDDGRDPGPGSPAPGQLRVHELRALASRIGARVELRAGGPAGAEVSLGLASELAYADPGE